MISWKIDVSTPTYWILEFCVLNMLEIELENSKWLRGAQMFCEITFHVMTFAWSWYHIYDSNHINFSADGVCMKNSQASIFMNFKAHKHSNLQIINADTSRLLASISYLSRRHMNKTGGAELRLWNLNLFTTLTSSCQFEIIGAYSINYWLKNWGRMQILKILMLLEKKFLFTFFPVPHFTKT